MDANSTPPAAAAAPAAQPRAQEHSQLFSLIINDPKLRKATDRYLQCIERCHRIFPERERPRRKLNFKSTPRAGSALRDMASAPMSNSYISRLTKWKMIKQRKKTCLQKCKKEWYSNVVKLLKQEHGNLPDDVLDHILRFLITQVPQRSQHGMLKKNKRGGRKTRRKKGTKRRKKSRKRSKRRKSKRRN